MADKPKKIESLTPEQLARLPQIRDEWLAIGTSTEPTERAAAEAAVIRAYKGAEMEPPRVFIWFKSPMAGCMAASMCRELSKLGKLSKPLTEKERESLRERVISGMRDTLREAVYGCHDAAWLAFYAAFAEFGVEACERLRPAMDVAKAAGWWWPYRGAVILTDRPTRLKRDEQGRLHGEDGPAIGYGDNWGIYSWHGVTVDRRLIEEPESITVDQIDNETNAEIRRVMLERYTYDRFILDSGAQLIDKDPQFGELYKRRGKNDDEDLLVVLVTNSTPEPEGHFKKYALRVRPDVTTAKAAVASTWPGVATEDYNPVLET